MLTQSGEMCDPILVATDSLDSSQNDARHVNGGSCCLCFSVDVKPNLGELKPISSSQRRDIMNNIGLVSNETMAEFDYLVGRRYDLVEICAPWDSNLGREVERQGGRCLRMGPHNGFDLSTKARFQKAAKVLRDTRPRHVHVSPACFPWTQWQNLNQRTEEQRRDLEAKRMLSRKILQNLKTLAEIQYYELGGDVSGEQPWTASSWKEPSWAKMAKMAGGRFRVDGCRFGMRHPENHKLLQKGWGFCCTNFEIQKAIHRTCNHPPSMHAHIEGKITALTAEYPLLLCKHFVTALMNRQAAFARVCTEVSEYQRVWSENCNQNDCEWALANDNAEGDIVDVPDHLDAEPDHPSLEKPAVPNVSDAVEPAPNSDGDQSTPEEVVRLRVIHKNLGHPPASVLHRMLKDAGVRGKWLKAALRLECDVCKKHAPRKPVLPATPNVPTKKWDVLSIDTFWWKHPKKNPDGSERQVVGISFMDEATDFQVACIVREDTVMPPSVSTSELKDKLLKHWLTHFPRPRILRSDVEGCFRGNG